MITLNQRVHTFARPQSKEQLIAFFTTVLDCAAVVIPGVADQAEPIIAFRFNFGGSLSVTFTDDALDEQTLRRGAYLEVQSDDAVTVQQRILDAGIPRMEFTGNDFFYFQAPGGQVMRVVSSSIR